MSKVFSTPTVHETLAAGALTYLNYLAVTSSIGRTPAPWSASASTLDALTKSFLHRVGAPVPLMYGDKTPLRNSASRYSLFKRLQKEHPWIVPTRDISVFWAADMLRPQSYENPLTRDAENHRENHHYEFFHHQQRRLLESGRIDKASYTGFGGLLKGTLPGQEGVSTNPATKKYDVDGDGILTKDERREVLLPWRTKYKQTEELWLTLTDSGIISHPYRVKHGKGPSAVRLPEAVFDESLVDAVVAQEKFADRVLKLGPGTINKEWVKRAVGRYIKFLNLAGENEGKMLVPTLDIDLVWHAHQLSPRDYREDCEEVVGRLLKHNSAISKEDLGGSFEETKVLWRERYGGEELVAKRGGVGIRVGNDRNYASCGSSGGSDWVGEDAEQVETGETLFDGTGILSDTAIDDGSGSNWGNNDTDLSGDVWHDGEDGDVGFFGDAGGDGSDCSSCGGD